MKKELLKCKKCSIFFYKKSCVHIFCSRKCSRSSSRPERRKREIKSILEKLGSYDLYLLKNRQQNWNARKNKIEKGI